MGFFAFFWVGVLLPTLDLIDAIHRAGYLPSTHLVLNALGMHMGRHIGLLPTAIHDPANGILLTSDFDRCMSMPAGSGPHSLKHATIKKFGHNMAVTANDSAKDLDEAARVVQDILDSSVESARLLARVPYGCKLSSLRGLVL